MKPNYHSQSPAICAMIDTLIRIGFAERLVMIRCSITEETSTKSVQATVRFTVINLLKQLGSAVWRLPAAPRFAINEPNAAGSDDREMFLLSQAQRLFKWGSSLFHLPQSQLNVQPTVSKSLLTSMQQLCNYLVRFDGAIWRGEYNDILPSSMGGPCTLQEFVERTRNYDKIILLAMTYDSRQVFQS